MSTLAGKFAQKLRGIWPKSYSSLREQTSKQGSELCFWHRDLPIHDAHGRVYSTAQISAGQQMNPYESCMCCTPLNHLASEPIPLKLSPAHTALLQVERIKQDMHGQQQE